MQEHVVPNLLIGKETLCGGVRSTVIVFAVSFSLFRGLREDSELLGGCGHGSVAAFDGSGDLLPVVLPMGNHSKSLALAISSL